MLLHTVARPTRATLMDAKYEELTNPRFYNIRLDIIVANTSQGYQRYKLEQQIWNFWQYFDKI